MVADRTNRKISVQYNVYVGVQKEAHLLLIVFASSCYPIRLLLSIVPVVIASGNSRNHPICRWRRMLGVTGCMP